MCLLCFPMFCYVLLCFVMFCYVLLRLLCFALFCPEAPPEKLEIANEPVRGSRKTSGNQNLRDQEVENLKKT